MGVVFTLLLGLFVVLVPLGGGAEYIFRWGTTGILAGGFPGEEGVVGLSLVVGVGVVSLFGTSLLVVVVVVVVVGVVIGDGLGEGNVPLRTGRLGTLAPRLRGASNRLA